MKAVEICAGAGGQALGLEQAGFDHAALVEIDPAACATLRLNRPHWNVVEKDVRSFSLSDFGDVALLAGGVPCPPFSVAGKQLGDEDERDLFPEALRLAAECSPDAVMLENVRGIFDAKFRAYRESILERLQGMGYACFWELVQASDFGVPQNRARSMLVALKSVYAHCFEWPAKPVACAPTVGQALRSEMAAAGWVGAASWAARADAPAPTLVGGSKKHGGPDLGPTRARAAWATLGVDGTGLADGPPPPSFSGMPKLTVKMASILQGFPTHWKISGKKTAAYRQVGNAFPPPVAREIGLAVMRALSGGRQAGRMIG
jgi:DNA (cytosine-5)-methyltransferase 1